MHHGGSVAILGIPPGDTAIDWNEVIFKGLDAEGHLRPGDVRDLVQDGEPAAEWAQHRPHHYASLWGAGVRERFRDDGVWEVGEGYSWTGVLFESWKEPSIAGRLGAQMGAFSRPAIEGFWLDLQEALSRRAAGPGARRPAAPPPREDFARERPQRTHPAPRLASMHPASMTSLANPSRCVSRRPPRPLRRLAGRVSD